MLTILNNYAHGYVAIPVILACEKYGLFKKLNLEKPVLFTELVEDLQANSGHLRAVLHMLESLNWVLRNDKDEYLITLQSDIRRKIPGDIMELMSFPMKDYLIKDSKEHSLGKWIQLSSRRWDVDNPIIADFLDGMLVIPLLLALKDNNFLDSRENRKTPLFSRINPAVGEEVTEFFINQGWLSQEKGHLLFTDTGLFIIDRIFITATVASYKPMLNNISGVIFGDCRFVFERDPSNHERHVDRTLNVIGSGFQHEKYFSGMEEIILSVFNREPFTEQPKYIADMGCGDGTLLKKVYGIIRDKSLRGKVLDEYPVKLIGIDFNEKALEETARTLKDIDHLVLKGDICDPEQMIADLKNIGVQDAENILHIRSFLDHDRPYIPPSDAPAEIACSNIPSEAVYVDKEGREILSSSVMQSLIEHFKRWVGTIGRHGIIILEVHCLEPKIISQFIDRCESLHFDAYHRFSQQLLVQADQFLMAAAQAGLFPNRDFFRKYPKTLPFSRITLNRFECRKYRIRYMQEWDLPALEQLEKQCWEPDLQVGVSVLKKRGQQYPEGQLVLEMDKQVVGVAYSRRIDNLEDLRTTPFKAGDRLYSKDGAIVQLLGVNILPEVQHQNLGDQLLEFMLQRCSLINGIRSVVGVTRCKDYYRHNNLSMQEYVGLTNEQGRLSDTILRFHELHGAKVKGLIPNYRPEDTKNQGYGILIEYDIYCRQRSEVQAEGGYREKGIGTSKREKIKVIKDFVEKTIILILGKAKKEAFSLERPLMEMGLDSVDLLELNEQISSKYRIYLEPAFFFKYRTAARIADYLLEQVDLGEAEEAIEDREPTNSVQDDQKGCCEMNEVDAVIANPTPSKRDIAIIGIACRLPGGIRNKEQLWELLIGGRDAIGKLPQQRFSWPYNIDPGSKHKGIDMGGFLDEIADFDAAFFRISPKEAELMDPQQRILLELSWECLENAGYPAKALFGSKTGVFIGACGCDYNNRLLERGIEEIEAHYGIGISMSVLANRISYFYDFNGPSLQIDTACSSSLVAVHEAVKSLQAGECEQALASGINIICHPSNSIAYYKAGMLSKDGRCKTFDKEANGYVRGEGAVTLLLKPLEQALSAKDTIFAVIKGSAINHGGQASGLTVPNPDRQAALLIEAYKTAGIQPETVGYIEAHGTGTTLGDPIEINGLKDVFSGLPEIKTGTPEPYCGLGSIKTNIGHLEAASGIAGLLKVILSMQHQMLPSSLNFNELNPHISLAKTPFYIVNKNRPWQLPDGCLLRRAGVSSFGSGGTNAHVVLEEAPIIKKQSHRSLPCCIICLSAKTEGALRQKERDLALWLEKEGQQHDLADISAALIFGREHFNIRAAYVAGDIQELRAMLNEVLEKGDAERYFRDSSSKRGKQPQPAYEELGRAISKDLCSEGKTSRKEYEDKLIVLAELYTKGFDPGWQAVFGEKRHHINLPTYPFERGYYWIPEAEAKRSVNYSTVSILHPLLQQNTSDLSEQRFSSTFTGEEFFLSDHVVKGQKVLPGVAYLEMARAAVEKAAGVAPADQMGIWLKNVVWARPIVAGQQPVEVHIGLYPEENGEIAYEIYSEGGKSEEQLVHSQGSAVLKPASEIPKLDIQELQVRCSNTSLSSDRCYEAFKLVGLDYGPGHRCIEQLYIGEGEVLARLSIPLSIQNIQEQYVLHPGMMDSALQASIVLMQGTGEQKPSLPFALDEIQIFRKCASAMWAYVRHSKGREARGKVQKLDVDICDEYGNISARIRGLSSRVLEDNLQYSRTALPESSTMLAHVWDIIPIIKGPTFPVLSERIVLAGDTGESRNLIKGYYPKATALEINEEDSIGTIAERLKEYGNVEHILWIAPYSSLKSLAADSLIEEQDRGVIQLFRIIKALLSLGYGSKELGWSIVTVQAQPIQRDDIVNPTHASVHGLAGSLAKEYQNWRVRVIDLEAGGKWPLEEIFAVEPEPQGNPLVYRNGKWYRQQVIPLDYSDPGKTMYKTGGVYVVIGGAGGIGEAWSEYMIRTYKAQIVWIGRRQKDPQIQRKLDKLAALGTAPYYIAADASDAKALHQAYEKIKGSYSRINGVIHSAIVLLDQSLAKMDEGRFRSSLSSKVDVSVRMAQVFGKEPLDFVVFFSSMQSFLKAPGQSNYAAGCTFKDAFAHQLANEWPCAVKVINWGYWGSIGIVASQEYRERMAKAGMGSIEAPEAMEALEKLLVGCINQVGFIKSTKPLIDEKLNSMERIKVYPDETALDIETILNNIPDISKAEQIFAS